jgi:acetylornithine/succinyldiaminopimelate/putrescine aminotransferase
LPGKSFFARYGDVDDVVRIAERAAATQRPIGAVLVEPVQGRGGERVPPPGFLSSLARLCDERGWLLIADEIYTGLGRTGALFACDHEEVIPDLLCVGKGLASGMPISACIGLESVFATWPRSSGEALHTQTFLGHPPSCAAALASLAISEREDLPARARVLGAEVLERLRDLLSDRPSVREVRGLGLMIGIECSTPEISLSATQRLLARGYVLLPSGDGGRVLSLTPPLAIGRAAILRACEAMAEGRAESADAEEIDSGAQQAGNATA